MKEFNEDDWLKLKDACEVVNVCLRTGYNRLNSLDAINKDLKDELARKENGDWLVRIPQILPILNKKTARNTPVKELGTRRQKVIIRTPEGDIYPDITNKRVIELAKESQKLELNESEKEEYLKHASSREKEMYITTKQICFEYSLGVTSLKKCCMMNGIDISTFIRWRQKMPILHTLYKQSKIERTENRVPFEVEEYRSVIRKTAEGYYYTEVETFYRVAVDIFGNEIRVPYKEIEHRKYKLPSLKAAMFGLRNLDPENWKY
ncbi:MAG: hypothetical protein OEW75_02515 [Cyclobacteriaceae bacterium]|nr:hypothetical protein [Cyclobacteriaceae bacterium]